ISDINIIVSTGSGTGLASAVWEQLVKPIFMRTGLSEDRYTVHETTSAESVAQLAQSVILPIANDGRQQLVVLLSGDGGVVDLVNTLVTASPTVGYRKPTIALLPLGTGNALASSAVVANDETLGLRTLLCGLPRQLPLFRATFSPGAKLLVNEGREEQPLQGVYHGSPATYGAVVCSWGLHATLVADSDTAEYRKFGAERFKMAANESLFPAGESMPHAYKGQVSTLRTGEKAEWERVARSEHGYILATLVSNLEAAFTISPSSRPLDGQLRLVHFAHVSGKEAMEIMMEAYQAGKHVEKARVGYEEIEAVKIEFYEEEGRWRRVCVDGKIVRVEKDGWVEVRKETENAVVDLVA
ncbi:ATP-NAD kinase-like domain-containing protein, partial [Neohortaea acidophila]